MLLKINRILLISIFTIVGPRSIADNAGRSISYSKYEKEIIVRSCSNGNLKRPKNCIGQISENRVDADYFIQVLTSSYLLLDSDKIKPVTEGEAISYKNEGVDVAEIIRKRKLNLDNKLSSIEKLLRQTKYQAKALQILKNARAQLLASDPSARHVLELNEIIQKIFQDKIAASQKRSVVESVTHENHNFWRQFDAGLSECGLADSQTIDERILSCATSVKAPQKSKTPVVWNLVARKKSGINGKFYEVWKDNQSGLIWGDLFDKTQPFYFLVDIDEAGKVVKDKLCSSPQYHMARAGIIQPIFRLPTVTDLEQAIQNGIGEVVPNMNNWYWSSTSFPNSFLDSAWGISNGSIQFRDFDFKYYYSSVRCVASNKYPK